MRQDRMHLDCVFSILGDDCCIMLEEMIGADSKTRRLVDEYTKDPVTKKYSLSRENVEFSGYMKDNGYHVIKIKPEHQLVSQTPTPSPPPPPPFETSFLDALKMQSPLDLEPPCSWVLGSCEFYPPILNCCKASMQRTITNCVVACETGQHSMW